MRGFLFVGGSVVLVTYAQLAEKWGMSALPAVGDWASFPTYTPALLTPILCVISGLLAYAVSMLCWLAALNYLPLNRAYPLLAISYGLVYLGAVSLPYYKETLTTAGILGVGLVLAGVLVINLRRDSASNVPR